MSFSEFLIILLVALFAVKPKDIPTILKKIKRIKSFIFDTKSEILSQIGMDKVAREVGTLTHNTDEMNFYLEKIIKLDGVYEGEYSIDSLKKRYNNLIQQKRYAMNELQLGKKSNYKDQYDRSLLYPISRDIGRSKISRNLIKNELPFSGYDIWGCYELSWLDDKGKPEVRFMRFIVPANSSNIIESKSVKLYLNSFNNTKFENEDIIHKTIQTDLSEKAEKAVEVFLYKLDTIDQHRLSIMQGKIIDDLDVTISDYNINSDLLKLSEENVEIQETLSSNLLKSNCLVTQQPDWASVSINYSGYKIDAKSLLKYLISFRNHNEFHEQCAERIFYDIMNKCAPKSLTVYAKFTRRGGIDISPFRSTNNTQIAKIDMNRDIRQ